MHLDVLKDPWITVVDENLAGKELSLVDLLNHANKLKEIKPFNNIYLTEYAIYRFITVFIMDAYQLNGRKDVIKLYKYGEFDPEIINAYIKKCKSEGVSFDVFDETWPFMQTHKETLSNLPLKPEEKPISYICHFFPSGNRSVFNSPMMQLKEATSLEDSLALNCKEYFICLLLQLVENTFTGSGHLNSTIYNMTDKVYPYFILSKGNNLFETIMLSMAINNSNHYDKALPIWRNKEYVPKLPEIAKMGYENDFMIHSFFVNEYIRFGNIKNGRIETIYTLNHKKIDKNMKKPAEFSINATMADPHVFSRQEEDKKKGTIVRSFFPRANANSWDNINNIMGSIFDLNKKDFIQPGSTHSFTNYELIKLYNDLKEDDIISEDEPLQLCMYYYNVKMGTRNPHPNVQGKRLYVIPQSYFNDETKPYFVQQLIEYANKCGTYLYYQIKNLWIEDQEKKDNEKEKTNNKEFSIACMVKKNFIDNVNLLLMQEVIGAIDRAKEQDLNKTYKKYLNVIQKICMSTYQKSSYNIARIYDRTKNENILFHVTEKYKDSMTPIM